MKFVLLIILLQYVLVAECKSKVSSLREAKTRNVIMNLQYPNENFKQSLRYIVGSWIASDISLHKLSEKFIQNILPQAFLLLSTSELSEDCSRDIVNFLRGIAETKIWAFKMLDAFGKLPNGISSGTVSSLGDYYTCLNTTLPSLATGKYCLLDIIAPLPKQSEFYTWEKEVYNFFTFEHNDTIMHEFLNWGEKLYMLKPRTTICIPSTCNIKDVELIANKVMQASGLGFNSSIKSCETKNDGPKATLFDIVLILLLFCLLAFVLGATLLDVLYKTTTDKPRPEDEINVFDCILYFSILKNAGRLLQDDDNPDSIKVFNGIRVITMIWLIGSHVMFVEYPEAYGSIKNYFSLLKLFWTQIFTSVMGVETFFFMSGVLLAHNILKAVDQNTSIGLVFLKRYIRITIPHLLMIAVTCVLPFFGTGPLHKTIIGKEAQNCKERGWMNLFYINNFIHPSEICMINTWYLSVDMQLFLIGILIIIPLRDSPRAAIAGIAALLFCGIFSTLVSFIFYNLPPTIIWINPQTKYLYDIWHKSYSMPHFHLPVYCIGLLVGYFLTLKKCFRVSLRVNILLWITSLSAMFWIVFGTYKWNKGNEFPGLMESILFGVTHRVFWALSLAWITIACHFDYGGVIARFLGSKGFLALSRVTFMTYLVNFTLKYLFLGTITNVILYSSRTMLNIYMTITIVAFSVSFLLSLIFEAPFISLEKALLIKLRGGKSWKGK